MAHILLVEDDERIRAIVERGLGARGFDVTSAPDGTAGAGLAWARSDLNHSAELMLKEGKSARIPGASMGPMRPPFFIPLGP